ncbi:MAG: hypothetical protein KC493_03365 [Bacteriovoracaceae bacterium]|nr:hypothetical protein [Bacteriovoracaceae bacterium]
MKTKNVEIKRMVKGALLLGLSCMVLTSCGGKKNQTNSADVTGTSPIFSNPQQQNDYNQIKAQFPCESGQRVDQNFQLQVAASQGNTISGAMTPGGAAGASNQTYFGVNAGFKDLMVVTQTGGNTFNVHLSLCAIRGQFSWFIGGDAQLTNFYLDFATLNTSVSCSYGNVDQANVRFTNSSFGQDGRSFTRVCQQ